MEEDCYICGGSGVVQEQRGLGYSGVCQRCHGKGKIFTYNGTEVSEADYNYYQLDQIGYYD